LDRQVSARKIARLDTQRCGNGNDVGDNGSENWIRLLHPGKAQAVLTPFQSHGRWSNTEVEQHLIGALTQWYCSSERKVVPTVGLPAISSSSDGVKIRTRASVPETSGGNTNVFGESHFIRHPLHCFSLIPSTSRNTASWLPVNG
jgi:hypothetical protein